MKYSILFGKTTKEVSSDASIRSHQLLLQAGFIRESVAGRYFFLPLGQRVMDKFVKIVEEEMAAIDSQKMLIPILQPIELWEETNRNKSGGYELMKVTDRRGAVFTPGGTGEEMFLDIVRKFQLSYRDLPVSLYQFGYKFRDEMRAKGGLMRTREFLMKDAYVFAKDEEQFVVEYNKMVEAYKKIYDRVGLTVDVVPADNGYFGGDYCHEFIQESPVGEGRYFVSEDGSYMAHEDIAKFARIEINPEEEVKQMEVIDQPEHVKTMEDNMKHYNLPADRFLKNVVYKNRETGQIIIATIRGDLSVNRSKLEHVIDMVGLLEDATDEDLASFGSKPGYVHSWGYDNDNVMFVGDTSLWTVKNFIGGQKEETKDTINVNYGRDFEHKITADIAMAEEGYLSEETKSKLIAKKGIEVGNTFNLGYFYSDKMKNATYMAEDGALEKYYMGSFGVGIARTVATVVETSNDENGIIWPEEIAPYRVHLISIASDKSDEAFEFAKAVYDELNAMKVEVLWDDRMEARPGEKFADADLVGIPTRVVVSARSLENGGVEVKKRNEKDSKVMKVEDFFDSLR